MAPMEVHVACCIITASVMLSGLAWQQSPDIQWQITTPLLLVS